jgi:hypothetical protein
MSGTRILNSERHWIIDYLRSDLYDREAPDSAEDGWQTWVSPLKWKVIIGGPPDDPYVRIYWPTGHLFAEEEHATLEWISGVLP